MRMFIDGWYLCSSVHKRYSTPHHLLPTKSAMPPNFSQVRLGQIRLVKVRLGQIRLGQVIFGQYWLVFSLLLNQITISVRFKICCYLHVQRQLVFSQFEQSCDWLSRLLNHISANDCPAVTLLNHAQTYVHILLYQLSFFLFQVILPILRRFSHSTMLGI